MSRRTAVLASAAAAATGVQVGAAMVATRFVVEQVPPAALAMLRYLIGFLVLLPLLLLAPRVRFARRDVVPIALLGITQFGILIALLNFGLERVHASTAAIVFSTLPLLTLVLAAVLGREALSAVKTAGVLITIAGVAIALGGKAHTGALGAQQWIGVAAVLASTLAGAVCSVLYRPYLRRYPVLSVSAFAMLASVLFLALLATAEGSLGKIGGIDARGWSAVVFIGFSSGVGYMLWLYALRHASPTRVTVFLSLSPITAALLGASFLGEAVSIPVAVGLACVMAGIALAYWPDGRDSAA